MELIASCAFGLEKLVYDEIKKLGLWVTKTEDGRVMFEGDEMALIRANLWLRCADRVQIKMAEFSAMTFDELFDHVNEIPWEKFVGANDSFPIKATSVKSELHSEPAIQSIVKKAVVKRLQKAHNTEQLAENSGATYQILVKANKNQFLVGINSSGESLHKRGYRTQTTEAPIKETLAAAIIQLAGWSGQKKLIDPFCGSGTLMIEAALIAKNAAPGLRREFAFQKWPWMDRRKMMEAYEEARRPTDKDLHDLIYGFDKDLRAIKLAERNGENAGLLSQDSAHDRAVMNLVSRPFQEIDFSQFENCVFVANPPYGERLEEKAEVQKMYAEFGKKFAQTKNCELFLITSDENFPRYFGRPADKNRKLFNGKIRCYLFSYFAK